jgi:hypothetical protein
LPLGRRPLSYLGILGHLGRIAVPLGFLGPLYALLALDPRSNVVALLSRRQAAPSVLDTVRAALLSGAIVAAGADVGLGVKCATNGACQSDCPGRSNRSLANTPLQPVVRHYGTTGPRSQTHPCRTPSPLFPAPPSRRTWTVCIATAFPALNTLALHSLHASTVTRRRNGLSARLWPSAQQMLALTLGCRGP